MLIKMLLSEYQLSLGFGLPNIIRALLKPDRRVGLATEKLWACRIQRAEAREMLTS